MRIIEVIGNSMIPTLNDRQLLLIKETHKFKVGDIILVKYENKKLIKRLMGLPNQKIRIINGTIFINDKIIKGKYTKYLNYNIDKEFNLGIDQYIVLGDNGLDSLDSRKFGPISKSQIIGKVIIKIWPVGLIS